MKGRALDEGVISQDVETFLADFFNVSKIILRQKNISISEWSRLSGISRAAIHTYLAGTQVPRIAQLMSLSNALGISISLYMSKSAEANRAKAQAGKRASRSVSPSTLPE